MTALCAGRPPQWWSTGDEGNTLAVQICRRCTGCPDDDPRPHGVIRQGVGYSDSGRALPPCSACGAPNTAYTGGDPTLKVCARCAVPQVPIPAFRASRNRWLAGLGRRGMPVRQIVAESGLPLSTVEKILIEARRGARTATANPQAVAA